MAGKYRFYLYYQVMIVKGVAKKYMGAISSEHRAARLYDKYSLII